MDIFILVLFLLQAFLYITIPLVFYFLFKNRDTKESLNYFAEYEYQPPTEDPYLMLYLDNFGFFPVKKLINTILMNMFYKKAIKIENGVIYFLDTSKLNSVELRALKIFELFGNNKKINEEELKNSELMSRFKKLSTELSVEYSKRGYFNGMPLFLSFLAYFFVSFVFIILSLRYFMVSAGLFIIAFFSLFIFGKKLNVFTKEGKLLFFKIKGFKKYLSDFTLLKEKPPSSIILWEKYLVFATALGVADKTIKAMSRVNPIDLEKLSFLILD